MNQKHAIGHVGWSPDYKSATQSACTITHKPQGDGCMERLVHFDSLRLKEYEDLQSLVNLAGSLNRGSGIVGKITQMEDIVDRLTRSDMVKPRQSFMQWLGDAAFNFHSENDKAQRI